LRRHSWSFSVFSQLISSLHGWSIRPPWLECILSIRSCINSSIDNIMAPYLQIFSLEGRIALITGAARGLGFEIALAMAGAGAHVVLNGRDAASLATAVREITSQGESASALAFDIADPAAVRAAFDEIKATYGRLDILVSNAGARNRKPLLDFSDEEIQAMVHANLSAGYVLAREAARLMVPRRSGRMITITSIAGQIARSGDPVYAGAKQGLTGMVRALAAEFGPVGITSNAIAPGGFATEANAAAMADPKIHDHFAKRTPLGRWGRPHEIAGAAVFLASEAASYVNGQVLNIDGGMSIAM
jgi:gluconate 5-dehydrogenase